MQTTKVFKCQICGKIFCYDKNYQDNICYFCKTKSRDFQVKKILKKEDIKN